MGEIDGVSGPPRTDVLIELRMTGTEPPTGVATVRHTEPDPVPFAGWLGLLRALTELLSAHADPAPTRRQPRRIT